MVKFGNFIVRHRVTILIIGFLMLIPCAIGYITTRTNYDILSYLPKDIETMKGQDILSEDFGKAGFSMVMIDGMKDKEVVATKQKIEAVEGVDSVVWYDSIADITLPKEILPQRLYDFFNADNGNSTLMIAFFKDTTAADLTLEAVDEIREIARDQCFVSGMSAISDDMKIIAESETLIYILVAVLLVSLVLAISMDSFLVPVFFMLSVGMAVVYNLGTNFIAGEISFLTKALAAVLQLGVTMDYSIFLYHSYLENKEKFPGDNPKAMGEAIGATIVSVVGSSITTVAGFLAMCFMSFTLGLDIGIVMAKGVVFGVICCITILPSMILIFDKPITKTRHRDFLPSMEGAARFIVKHSGVFITVFFILLSPAIYGNFNNKLYYKLDSTLPKDLDSVIANTKLAEEYGMNSTHMLLISTDVASKDVRSMCKEIEQLDGIEMVLGLDSLIGSKIPSDIIPESITELLQSDDWKLVMVGSEYEVASDAVNAQCSDIKDIISKYDDKSMLIGEAPATKDLIEITNRDFKVVNILSIGAIFIIIFFVLRSFTLPVILVSVIEFAIFVNMAIPTYMGTEVAFVASIVIGTIQLGATVDYAILMTTRYKLERSQGLDKHDAVTVALATSMKSVMISALGFFAATIGVGLVSEIGIISELCTLLARGALISMFTVIFALPSFLLALDKVICATTSGMKRGKFDFKVKHYPTEGFGNDKNMEARS
ncbi:MAG: MMPL family transporter [Ruminococcus sp.]|nr:MMPL family transporter [Ruminococcus sp.]